MAKKFRNFLDPLGNRKPSDRVIYRKSKKDVNKTYLNEYRKMYPDKKFTIRKSKQMKPQGERFAFEVFYRKR